MIKANQNVQSRLRNLFDGMQMSRLRQLSIAIDVAALALMLASLALIFKNTSSLNFWFDESDQVLLSMGQDIWGPAHSPWGTLGKVWELSKWMNADPGGFTVIVRYAMEVLGTTPIALRCIPLFFGLAGIFCLIRCSTVFRLPLAVALLPSLLMLSNDTYRYFLFEVRAYSMESTGVIAIFLVAMFALQRQSAWALAAFLLTVFVFASGRYSFVVYEAAICGSILLYAMARGDRSFRIPAQVIGFVFVMNLVFYFGMLRFQVIPQYILPNTLSGKSIAEIWEVFSRNLFDLIMLPKIVFLGAVAVEVVRTRASPKKSVARDSSWRWLFFLSAYVAIAESCWVVLSFAGRIPWDYTLRWSLSEVALSGLALAGTFAVIRNWLAESPLGFVASSPLMRCAVQIGAASIASIMMSQLSEYDRSAREFEQLYPAITMASERGGGIGTIILDRNLWPDFRYLTEFAGISITDSVKQGVKVVDYADLNAVAEVGLRSPRPVAFIFATWNPDVSKRLAALLPPEGQLNAVGNAKFTYLISLR